MPDLGPAMTRSPVRAIDARWRSTLNERSKQRSGDAAIRVSSSMTATDV